jgi:hypothetical protein
VVVADEFEVSKAETLGAALASDGQLLAGAHGKEKGTPCQLVGGLVERAIIVLAEFSKEAGSEGLLGAG